MKKFLSIILAAILLVSMGVVCASASDTATPDEAPIVDGTPSVDETPSADVYVTIVDEKGAIVVAAEELTVTDTDGDEALTINDALFTAHEKFYEGGAAAGYATSVTQYGLGITKLWGTANGGSYGYYVNNASAWALTDPIKDADYVAAFVYTDPVGWTDNYSYFDSFMAEITAGEELTLTYYQAGYDAEWNPVTLPVAGAVITVDGEATDVTTDAEGKAAFTISEPGTHIVSAVVEGKRLVTPVLIAKVNAPFILGDADSDGEVTIMDATRIQRFIAELIGEDDIDMKVSDADKDGIVTVLDATHIQRFIAEIITEL